MSHDVIATKFRPQSFDELIGQEFVVATLKNSISQNRIANAYLLSGPRGIGKTSAARIIAKSLNCKNGPTATPCNQCENCITITQGYNNDVIEIDGASNTGINDIRVIQEEIQYPPVNSKYKVYIIDEVHMLSKSAFNALLKTIEEPPVYVVFIFATTEINKVLPTIRSRCQQFNFRLIPVDFIYEALIKILNKYNIKYEEEAVCWIAQEGHGSMRDAYTLLDQVISFCNNDITLSKIQEKLGLIGDENIAKLVMGIINNNREIIFKKYYFLLEKGIAPEQILIELIDFFRNILLLKLNIKSGKYNTNIYTKELITIFSYQEIENILEILFKTYETSKISIKIEVEIELCLLKLLNYKELIRPKNILNELLSLKTQLLQQTHNNVNIDKNIKKKPDHNKDSSVKKEEYEVVQNHLDIKQENGDILKIIKNKFISVNFQLVTALNHVIKLEETDNAVYLSFNHKMHFDIVKSHEEILSEEILAIKGEKNNKDFKLVIQFIPDKKTQSIIDINKSNIKDIFHGKEL